MIEFKDFAKEYRKDMSAVVKEIDHLKHAFKNKFLHRNLHNEISISSLFLGLGIGAVVALLITPKKGEELREEIADGWDRLMGKAEELSEQTGKQISKTASSVKTNVSNVANEAAGKIRNDLGFDLSGKWNSVKGKVKQAYSSLNDNDLNYVEGKGEELFGRLQEKTGKGRDELVRWLNSL